MHSGSPERSGHCFDHISRMPSMFTRKVAVWNRFVESYQVGRPGADVGYRELATAVCDDWGVSIRRACTVLEFDRSTYHYKPRRREPAGLEARIKEIWATRVRYGYRRVHVL
jgi:hypothetical protein